MSLEPLRKWRARPLPRTGEGNSPESGNFMTAQSPGSWGKVLLEWRLMGKRRELSPIPKRCFQHQPAAKQNRLPACSSKHHKFSACSLTHILQNAARVAAPLYSETSHTSDAAGQNPYWCFSKTHAGSWAARGCQGSLWNMSPKSDNYSHTDIGSQTTPMIIFLAPLSEVGLELASLGWPHSFTYWALSGQ